MPLTDADVLFGKLAIGRNYLSRADALSLAKESEVAARSGRREELSSTAVRLGFLEPRRAAELTDTIQRGVLICRGSCAQRAKLSSLRPAQTVVCGVCGGPVYVARELGPPPAAPLPAGRVGTTLMTFEAPDLGAIEAELEAERQAALATPTPAAPLEPDVPQGTYLDLFDDTMLPPQGGVLASKFTAQPKQEEDVTSAVEDPDFPPSVMDSAELTLQFEEPQFLREAEATTVMNAPGSQEPFEPFSIGPDLRALAPIGKGGMGFVFRAERPSTGEVLAVKVLAKHQSLQAEALARFEREVTVTTRLDHSSMVKVYDTGVVAEGEHAGRPYFTMDYIQGRDLTKWVTERKRSAEESAALMAQVCAAMDYAHGRGVVHRDLKPENVIVRASDDAPMICDFGLAFLRANTMQVTGTGDILGTPLYMPPEQALGDRKKIGPPTDVYALGAITFFLLTGRAPFTGPTAFAIIDKVVKEPPPSVRSFNAAVPPKLESIVLKALAKKPQDRFRTCGELKAALAECV